MTELEKSIYSAIDVLQKQIANDKMAISGLLDQLPCKYMITRTFIKDYSSHKDSISAGYKLYYGYFEDRKYTYNPKTATLFRSLRDAEFYLEILNEQETLKNYVEIKIERVDK